MSQSSEVFGAHASSMAGSRQIEQVSVMLVSNVLTSENYLSCKRSIMLALGWRDKSDFIVEGKPIIDVDSNE